MTGPTIPDPPADVETTEVTDRNDTAWIGIVDEDADVNPYWVRVTDPGMAGWSWTALWRRCGPLTWPGGPQ